MLLLSGHSLTVNRKVPLEALGINLSERESTANMTPADMTGITVNSWFQDDTEPGKGIVWRVRSIQQIYGTQTTQIQLEHAVNTLKDRILFGEITPEKMSGRKGAKNCTAKEAIQYILKQQSDWTLGTMAFNVSNPYKFDGNTLYEALETVSNSLEDCWWSYDFSSYPFKINFTKKSSDIGTIFRAGRNLTAITKTIDRTGMYTRFYPIGKDDLHVSGGGYVEKNAGTYGVISKVETDQTLTTQAELTRWANERLAKHAEPVVTIDVEGLELSEQTGESMDKLVLGRMGYIPLPEFGTEILETITAANYQDKLFKPEVVRITLANNRNDVTKIIAEEIRRGGGGGRAAARQAKEDHTWFINTDETIGMMAKWQDETTAHIQLMDGQIEAKVEKNGVISAINLSTEGAVIKGSKITLDGTVWATDINSLKATVDDLSVGDFTGVSMKCFTMAVNSNYMTLGGSTISKQTYTIDGVDYKLLHWN